MSRPGAAGTNARRGTGRRSRLDRLDFRIPAVPPPIPSSADGGEEEPRRRGSHRRRINRLELPPMLNGFRRNPREPSVDT